MKTLLILAVLILIPRMILAQSAPENWDNLARLRTGHKIQVVDMKLKSTDGSFLRYSDTEIAVQAAGREVAIPRASVFSIKDRERSHRGRNTLIGLAAGAAAGLTIGAIKGKTYHEAGETPVFVAVWTPIGAGVGAAVGALLPPGQVTIYRAKPARPATEP